VPGAARVWESQESLSDLTLWADWDWFASMIASLRLYLFEHGTVPTWNFMFCGGHPELADPQSWAWTWPSLLAYLLPPNHALFALWLGMTLVGFAALRGLLFRWSQSALGSTVGACVFVFSGFFAARFNAGHASYVFYHGVLVLILCFERGIECGLGGRRLLRPAALATLVSFLFISSALPHALLHFYPAFALWLLLRLGSAARSHGIAPALRIGRVLVGAHALGMLLAAYKLWPVIRWQLDQPRANVFRESYSVMDVLSNTLVLIPDYFTPGPLRPHYQLASWGYNAFVGPVPWALAIGTLLAAAALVARQRKGSASDVARRPPPPNRLASGFAAALIGIGFSLSIGNANPLGLASGFEHLPILNGIRGFNRYQALIVFGVAILCAQSFPLLAAAIRAPRIAKSVQLLFAAGCIAPVLTQSALLVWNIRAEPRDAILASYSVDDAGDGASADPPRQIALVPFLLRQGGHQTALLDAGYWIANCYSSLTPAPGGPTGPANARIPLSTPHPLRARVTGHDQIILDYPAGISGDVALHLRVPEGARLDVPFRRDPKTLTVVFRGEDLVGGRLHLTAGYAGPAAGARISLVGAVLSAAFALRLRRTG